MRDPDTDCEDCSYWRKWADDGVFTWEGCSIAPDCKDAEE